MVQASQGDCDLVDRASKYQSKNPVFKTAGLFFVLISLFSSRDCGDVCQEFVGAWWLCVTGLLVSVYCHEADEHYIKSQKLDNTFDTISFIYVT